jgi:preprotein translocase subunit SecE
MGAKRHGSGIMARFNPFEFIQEVRSEVAKVTWPTRKEVWVTSLMVLMMVVLASLFFLLADQLIGAVVKLVLGLGS